MCIYITIAEVDIILVTHHNTWSVGRKLKLSKRVLKSDEWKKNLRTEEELDKVNEELDLLLYNRRLEMENKAISRINSDPKYFYKYQKRFGKISEPIADLRVTKYDTEYVISDDKGKADTLNEQYSRMWSNPSD